MTHQNDFLYKVVLTASIHHFQCGDSMTNLCVVFTFLSSASFSSLLMMYSFPLSLYCSLDSGMYQQISLHGFSFTSSIFELLQAYTGNYIKLCSQIDALQIAELRYKCCSLVPGVCGKSKLGRFTNKSSVDHGAVGRFAIRSDSCQLEKGGILQLFV